METVNILRQEGLEVLRRLKANPRTRSIPVVILTSSKEERDLITSDGLGANSCIQKPVDFQQFRTIVKNVGYYWPTNQPPLQFRRANRQRNPRALLVRAAAV